MQLAHAARIDLDQRRRDRGGHRETLLESLIRTVPPLVLIGCCAIIRWLKLCGTGGRARDLVAAERPRNRSGEDVALAGVGRVAERRGRHAEVLGQHVVRRVLEPVADQEGVVFVEVAVVEHQQELAAVRPEALDRMRNARREIPEIADAHVVDEVAPLRIDGGNARGAVEHVGPLRRLVPVQFAHAAGVEAHVHAGDGRRDAELAHGHLSRPPAGFQPHMRVGEREAQVRQRAVVGRRRDEQIGVLPIPLQVTRAGIGAAVAGTARLWRVARLCVAPRGRRRDSSRCCSQHVST